MLELEITQSGFLTVSTDSKNQYIMLSSAAIKHVELCKAWRQDYIFKVINHAACSQMTVEDRACKMSFDHL